MSHWAEIDENNTVLRVLVGNNSEPDEGEAFMNSLGGTWVKTSYNGNIRKNFAGIGYTYDAGRDAFIAPKPYNSWVLNEETCQWEPPIPKPTNPPSGKFYAWSQSKTEWLLADELPQVTPIKELPILQPLPPGKYYVWNQLTNSVDITDQIPQPDIETS